MDALFGQLPAYGERDISGSVFIGSEAKALVKQVDIAFTDGSRGSAFIVTSASAVLPEMRMLLIEMLIAIILILIFTAS